MRAAASRILGVFVVVVTAVGLLAPSPASGGEVSLGSTVPFRGLGAWVDAFDYAAAFQNAGATPSVTPESVPDMAALGVKTLYLQAAMNDDRSPQKIIDPVLVGEFLTRAHRAGMKVVAWYFPTLTDPDVDVQHMKAMLDFRARGQRFDGYAVDIEATQGLPDVQERNDRAVDVTARSRKLVGSAPLAAVVYPAVQIEVLNQTLWPSFPYKRLAKSVDAWMPMAYWTFRNGNYRDPYTYTNESITRLRANLDDPRAVVHPIGGIGDLSSVDDYGAFMRSVADSKSIGWSIYDFNTMASSAWPILRATPAPTTPSPTTAS